MNLRAALPILAALTLLGCSIANPTAESLGDDVAGMLGVRPGQVKVTDIESKDNKTYFVATTPNGTYNCATDSGLLVAVVSPTIGRTCTPTK